MEIQHRPLFLRHMKTKVAVIFLYRIKIDHFSFHLFLTAFQSKVIFLLTLCIVIHVSTRKRKILWFLVRHSRCLSDYVSNDYMVKPTKIIRFLIDNSDSIYFLFCQSDIFFLWDTISVQLFCNVCYAVCLQVVYNYTRYCGRHISQKIMPFTKILFKIFYIHVLAYVTDYCKR